MIVIAIIGILAAIAIPQFSAYRIRGFNASAMSDARNCATSEAAFFSDWQIYGVSEAAAVPGTGGSGAGAVLTGPSAGADIISGTAATVVRGLDIPLGNGVSLIASTDALSVSFTCASKHLQGDSSYATDSDTTSVFQDPTTLGVGDILVAASCPVSTTGDDSK